MEKRGNRPRAYRFLVILCICISVTLLWSSARNRRDLVGINDLEICFPAFVKAYFDLLAEECIPISLITTSETEISLLIADEYTQAADAVLRKNLL